VLVKLKANVRRGNKLMWDFEFRVYVTYESVHVEDPVESVYLGEGWDVHGEAPVRKNHSEHVENILLLFPATRIEFVLQVFGDQSHRKEFMCFFKDLEREKDHGVSRTFWIYIGAYSSFNLLWDEKHSLCSTLHHAFSPLYILLYIQLGVLF